MLKALIVTTLSLSSISWALESKNNSNQIILNKDVLKRVLSEASTKKSEYIPLFNHFINPSTSQEKSNTIESEKKAREEIVQKLVEFLTNQEMGAQVAFEYVSQTENDTLLRLIVKNQFKQKDIITLIDDYNKTVRSQISDLFLKTNNSDQAELKTNEAFKDGQNVLQAFLSVQNRIEDIESGLWDLNDLPEELKNQYSGINFLCFYSWYNNSDNLELYKIKTIREYDIFIRQIAKNNPFSKFNSSNDVKKFNDTFMNYNKEKIELVRSNEISQKTINKLLNDGWWSRRLIIANCLKDSTVLKWKNQLKESLNNYLKENKSNPTLRNEDLGLL